MKILDYCKKCNLRWERDTKNYVNFCSKCGTDLLPQKPREYFERIGRKKPSKKSISVDVKKCKDTH